MAGWEREETYARGVSDFFEETGVL